MTTPDIQSLVESPDGAIAFAQSGTSTGGELTHTALNTLATELTRLRAELAEEKRKVEVALRPIIEDVETREGHAYEEENWNEDCQVRIELRVREFRVIRDMLK